MLRKLNLQFSSIEENWTAWIVAGSFTIRKDEISHRYRDDDVDDPTNKIKIDVSVCDGLKPKVFDKSLSLLEEICLLPLKVEGSIIDTLGNLSTELIMTFQ